MVKNPSIRNPSGSISPYGFACGYTEPRVKGDHYLSISRPGMYYLVSHWIGNDSQGTKRFSHLADARAYVRSVNPKTFKKESIL